MSTLEPSSIVIIGQGKVGQSLGALFSTRGHRVIKLARDYDKHLTQISSCDIVFICVNDDAIENVCEALSKSLNADSIVTHCSGALDSSILHSAAQVGCSIASCHPLNTFPSIEASLTKFAKLDHGSYIYTEGENRALETLLPIFEDAGFISQEIARSAKPLYHAACVFACNYLTSLMDMSLETARSAKLDEAMFWQSLQPLIQSTLSNIGNSGTTGALSGPIARADIHTVKKHLTALEKEAKSLSANYATLGVRALEIAQRKGELGDAELSALREILDQSK